ncbi:NYN domain-containing protein [Nitrosomonas communis]|uniref:NYN domain-containing protein n=1 Tax=Nitrosomonas communis TaxID=44574 RepID=UPI0034E953C8|nr:NYN domain-containing protein [Nitrosomonas communis]
MYEILTLKRQQTLAYKKSVDQIILIAGDSDFVPAAKLARREGVDFILDPMGNFINPDLHEHIRWFNI